jgi:hypothetical protein
MKNITKLSIIALGALVIGCGGGSSSDDAGNSGNSSAQTQNSSTANIESSANNSSSSIASVSQTIASSNLAGYTIITEHQEGASFQNIQRASYIFLPNDQVIVVFDLYDGSRKVARGTYNESDGNNVAILSPVYDNDDTFAIHIAAMGISSPGGVDLITVGESSAIPYDVSAIITNDDNGIDEESVTNIVIESSSSSANNNSNSDLANATSITIYNNTNISKLFNGASNTIGEEYTSKSSLHCTDFGYSSLVIEDNTQACASKTYMKNLSNMCIEFDCSGSKYSGSTNVAYYSIKK